MGQKSNPIGLRLGINREWDSVWIDEKNFADKIHEDMVIRKFIDNKLSQASIASVQIFRSPKKVQININTARPGIIIGKGGSEIEILKKQLKKLIGHDISVNVTEVKRPALKAKLVGENIAQQLTK